jgi:hypothetical protein
MPEFHPSISAVGLELDEETTALPQRHHEEKARTLNPKAAPERPASPDELKMEEAMHLDL